MTMVYLTIHRSAHTIGGNCIEITTSEGHRLILDAGRPLDAPVEMTTGLIPSSLDINTPIDGLLLSHSHQDHYGLLNELPISWPVFCGEPSEKLIRLTASIFGDPPKQVFRHWQSEIPFTLGPFTITPYLTDHSAFDAYMLQVDVHGRRLLYSGDFRIHGRKQSLVKKMLANPPKKVDILIMEGTNIGSDKPCLSESDLETEFTQLLQTTPGRVFVGWSAQNIDRTVTLFRACKRTNRTMVVDLYGAEVLETLAAHANIPRPGWPNLKVVITSGLSKIYNKKGQSDFIERMVKQGIAAKRLCDNKRQWLIMTRSSLIRDYQRNNVIPTPEDVWSWSMWSGYLQEERGQIIQSWFEKTECPAKHIHTSGHASPTDLQEFAEKIAPRFLVPVHGIAWDGENTVGFPAIQRLADGEMFSIPTTNSEEGHY